MKLQTLSLVALLAALSAHPAQLVVNPGFETTPFPSGWTSSLATADPGLNGSTIAARLPYNTLATLRQSLAAPVGDFTFDVSLTYPGFNTEQAFAVALETDTGVAVRVRVATNGALQIDRGGGWTALVRASDETSTALPINQTIRLRVIGRNWGGAAPTFDVAWSEPGAAVLDHAATGLTAFAGTAPAGGLRTVRFDRSATAHNSFIVDDVTVEDSASAPPAADHVLSADRVVNISGIYPHLAMTNTHDECGVGAVVPWAGSLWAITYGPHLPTGGTDKLYTIATNLVRVTRPESIGGTPANRFIHLPSNQLIIGPHFVNAAGVVRTIPYTSAPGRHTAVAAHLSDPANRLYLFTMEDGLYDVNVNDLSFIVRYPDVQSHGDNFLSGYHGKGAYSGQGRLVVGNNGESNQTLPSGVLATWDGSVQGTGTTPQRMIAWNEIERIQTCEVTGPGGISGNPNPATDPIWTTGFDPKSVILHTLEAGVWHTWRLPKASYTHDGAHGWHTEWPRIRQLDPADSSSPYLMHMHGLFYDFPKTFSAANFSGLHPLCSYYKMPVDYCLFDGRLVMGKNDTSRFSNALVPKAQSNLWFGQLSDLQTWGAPTGHGAVWMDESLADGAVSDPFLLQGFPMGTLHLRNQGATPVSVEVQSTTGASPWTPLATIAVPAGAYVQQQVNAWNVPWVRLHLTGGSSDFTAFFHLASPYPHHTPASLGSDEFAALADIRDQRSLSDGLVRVMDTADLKLEFASSRLDAAGLASPHRYHQAGGSLRLLDRVDATAETAVRTTAATTQAFGFDAASAWVTEGANRFRLPKLDPLYESAFAAGWARGFREVVTERQILNCHGTLYEVPRSISGGVRKMRALTTHGKRITDLASWRGLLVLTGVLDSAPASDRLVKNADGTAALWLGEVDDLWRMGEPRGVGGPWKDTVVAASTPSDPYLMYGYDRKELALSHTSPGAETFTVQVDFLGDNTWSDYAVFPVPAGATVTHLFPEGFHAHWVRVVAGTATTATAQFTYGPATVRDEFLDWARSRNLPTGAGRSALAVDDSDSDDLDTLAEFYLGSDPSSPASTGRLSVLPEGAIRFRRNQRHGDIGHVVETSPSLTSPVWTARPEWSASIVPGQSDAETDLLEVPMVLGSADRLYVRLRIAPVQ